MNVQQQPPESVGSLVELVESAYEALDHAADGLAMTRKALRALRVAVGGDVE